MSVINLEKYYMGEVAWQKFVSCFDDVQDIDTIKTLKKLFGDQDISRVLYAKIGDASLEWAHRTIPALDGLRPIDCVYSDVLIKRLKTLLLRM